MAPVRHHSALVPLRFARLPSSGSSPDKFLSCAWSVCMTPSQAKGQTLLETIEQQALLQ